MEQARVERRKRRTVTGCQACHPRGTMASKRSKHPEDSPSPGGVNPSNDLPNVNPWTLVGLAGLFALLHSQMRAAYHWMSGSVHTTIPGTEAGKNEVDETHALVACMVFSVGFFVNINAALWSLQISRYRLNLQVAFISAVAAYTHYQMYIGKDWYVSIVASDRTISFSALRQLEWAFTTPIMLSLIQNLHAYAFAALPSKESKSKGGKEARGSTYTPVSRFRLIMADELMLLCGLGIPLTTGLEYQCFVCVSMTCFAFVMWHSLRALADIMMGTELDLADAARVFSVGAVKFITWCIYPICFFLAELGYIDCRQLHEAYLVADVLTKFSYTLLVSAGSLRFIEVVDEHRRQHAIAMSRVQRAFFFNITHELRTPLNSIIGFNTLATESGELTEFTESFIKASLTSAEALLGLINQVLDFAKVGRCRLKPAETRVESAWF